MAIPPAGPDQWLARIAQSQIEEQNRAPAVEETASEPKIHSSGATLRPSDMSMGEMVASRAGIIPMAFASSEISKDFQRLDQSASRRKSTSRDDESREATSAEQAADEPCGETFDSCARDQNF